MQSVGVVCLLLGLPVRCLYAVRLSVSDACGFCLQALAQDKQLAVDLWNASCAAVGWSDDKKQ
jgi:hypothetical protein